MVGLKLIRRKQDKRDLKTLKRSVRGLLRIICQFLNYIDNVVEASITNVDADCVITMMSFATMMKSYISIYVNNKFARPGLMFSIENEMAKIDESISSIRKAITKILECEDENESVTLFTDQFLEIGKYIGEIRTYLRMMSLTIHQDNIRIDCGVDIIQEYYDNIKDLKNFYAPHSSKYVVSFTNENLKKEEIKNE